MNTLSFVEDPEDLYRNAPFGYFTMSSDGTIVNVNQTLLNWLGFTREEVVFQRSLQDLLGMGEKIYFETHLVPMLHVENEVAEINLTLLGAEDRFVPCLLNGVKARLGEDAQTFFRCSVIKIAQRKLYEVELLEARKEADRMVIRLAQVNQDLERFAHTASHDLQAPVNTIYGLISLLERKGYSSHDSDGVEYFKLIKSNLQRMKRMITDLLEYAKIEGDRAAFAPIPLHEVCSEAAEMIAADVRENSAVITISELPTVVGDRTQLIRLFQNLFSNAIKYRSEAAPEIVVSCDEAAECFTVRVRDNGMGFEPQHAERIFGFMKRLHSHDAIAGSGIGLSACQRIVELHGGEIGATSEPGLGSTFFFTLPKSVD